MNNRSVLIQERFGGIVVSITFIDKKKDNLLDQINYIIPRYKKNGSLVNEEINKILVGRNSFLISLNNNISEYIRILGQESRIEFSKMRAANKEDLFYLKTILRSYSHILKEKKIIGEEGIKKLTEFTHNGDIYNFDKILNEMNKKGIRFSTEKVEELRQRCYKSL